MKLVKSNLFFLLFLSLWACTPKNYLADVTSRNYRMEKGAYTHDGDIAGMIAPYKEKLDAIMLEVIGQNEVEMVKGKPNSPLTNWFADALYEEMNATKGYHVDFAVQNYGGVRVNSLAAGPVTVGSIYELMPFDNTMYVVTMKGHQVQALLDKIVDSNGWPLSKSVQCTSEFGKAAKVKLNGAPLDPEAEYIAAIPDYVANGGDNLTFLKDCPRIETGLLVRDILINYVKRQTAEGKILKADPTPRILSSGNE